MSSSDNSLQEDTKDRTASWDKYFNYHWEKAPFKGSKLISAEMDLTPPCSSIEFFEMVRDHISAFIQGETTPCRVRFFSDVNCIYDTLLENSLDKRVEMREYLPLSSDKSFDEYHDRLQKKFDNDNQKYILILDPVNISPVFRNWIYGVLKNIYSGYEYIVPGSFISVFHGNYEKTPFGAHVHNDTEECEGAIYFCLGDNDKKIRTWSDQAIQNILDNIENNPSIYSEDVSPYNYKSFNKDSELVFIQPGEFFYWTSDTWHVAEDQTQNVIAFPLAVKVAYDCVKLILQMTAADQSLPSTQRELIDDILQQYDDETENILQKDRAVAKIPFKCQEIQKLSENIPDEIRSVSSLLTPVLSDKEIEIVQLKFWLRLLTSYGFFPDMLYDVTTSQQPVLKTLQISNTVRLYKNVSLIHAVYDSTTFVSSAGRLIEYTSTPHDLIKSVLEILNTNQAITIEDLVDRTLESFGGDKLECKDYVQQLVMDVSAWDVLEVR